MKKLLLVLLIIIPIELSAQFNVEFHEGIGFSSLTNEAFKTGMRLSVQSTFHISYTFNERFSVRLGSGYQLAGASNWVQFTDNNGIIQGQVYIYYSQHFIKFPADFSVSFGNELRWSLDMGCYYNLLVHYAQNPEEASGISYQVFDSNYFGIRLKAGYEYPLSDKASIHLGMLVEHSLFNNLFGEQYNVYLNTVLKLKL